MDSIVKMLSVVGWSGIVMAKAIAYFPSVLIRKTSRQTLITHLYQTGIRTLPVITVVSLFTGMILALQVGLELRRFNQEVYLGAAVMMSLIREMAPFSCGLCLAACVGSAIAAEIGTMKVNDEINALETMGIPPLAYLVFPKLLAMLIAMPLLTVIGDVAGIAGGMLVGVSMEIPLAAYWSRTITVLDFITFLLGIGKTLCFAVLITLAGCFCGFKSPPDAQGVGRGATSAVVASIFLVVVADAVITLLYSFIGY